MSRTPMSRRFHRALRSPAEFTKRGWREVLTRTGQAMSAHNMPIVAAGIAFYMVWALFPALVALVLLGITVLGEQEMLHLLSRIRVDLPSSVDAVIGALLSAIAIVYRYGPARRKAKWRWVSWGAAASAIVWVIGSFLFSYYASRYMRANLLLGSLGAATIFMLWSYLTVLTLLFGAQINVEMEREADVETSLDR